MMMPAVNLCRYHGLDDNMDWENSVINGVEASSPLR